MAETQITRCPHCQTTFRIRLEQLAKAKGAVRCGSCLQVFKAGDHLVSHIPGSEKPAATKPVTAKPVAAKPVAAKPVAAKPVAAKPTVAKKATAAPVQKTIPKAKVAAKPAPEPTSSEEVLFNDDPLEDLAIHPPEHKIGEVFESSLQLDDSVFSMQEDTKPSRYSLLDQNQGMDFDLSDEFDNNNSDESWASNLMEDDNNSSSKPQDDDESWADSLLDIDDELAEDVDMNSTKANSLEEKDDFVPSLEDDTDADQFYLGGDEYFGEETVEIDLGTSNSINNLLDEPLNLSHKTKKKAAKTNNSDFTWLWAIGSFLMLLAMVVQVGYFKFDTWSRHPDYRSTYAMTCQIINCQLPAIQNVNKMNTQHFMVRLHPEVEQALYIDTLLVNNAPYSQPFPDLNLVFTGLENEIIASRRFEPKEYLAGELAGATVMPLNVPIHIALEILNPGAEAVSYRIELMANH